MEDFVKILDGSKIDDYIALALAIVGFCSVLVQALEKIAKITPNTKDDQYVSVIKKYLGYASSILSFIALNLPKSSARVDTKAAAADAAKAAVVDSAKEVLTTVVNNHNNEEVINTANKAIDALDYGKKLIQESDKIK